MLTTTWQRREAGPPRTIPSLSTEEGAHRAQIPKREGIPWSLGFLPWRLLDFFALLKDATLFLLRLALP